MTKLAHILGAAMLGTLAVGGATTIGSEIYTNPFGLVKQEPRIIKEGDNARKYALCEGVTNDQRQKEFIEVVRGNNSDLRAMYGVGFVDHDGRFLDEVIGERIFIPDYNKNGVGGC